MSPEQMAERVYERLAEDERLRGSLTDAGYGPLLDWAAGCALAQAPRVAGRGQTGMDWLAQRLREALATLVQAAEGRQEVSRTPVSIVAGSAAHDRVAKALAQPGDPDSRAAAAAAALAEPADDVTAPG
jgi:hypothetical protein